MTDACLEAAHDVLRKSATPDGWLASASDFAHYAAVWTRDAALTGLATGMDPDSPYLDVTRATLLGLADRQADLGQMPVAYFPADSVWDWGETGNTDGTALAVLLAAQYLRARPDDPMRDRITSLAERALTWLQYQDANNFRLIDSPQAADWMDSTLNRSGKVLYNNVLFYAALRAFASVHPPRATQYLELAAEVRRNGNILFWPQNRDAFHQLLSHVAYPAGKPRFSHSASIAAYEAAIVPGRTHYVAHVEYACFVDRCDVLANCLAVLVGFADGERSRTIARALANGDAVTPYPARAWSVPFTMENDTWGVRKLDSERFQDARWHNPPHRYHNAAVWPFIGGYVVAALVAAGEIEAAKRLLPRLADANAPRDGDDADAGFPEWIDGHTGEPGGGVLQTWSAAAYVMAAHAVRQPAGWQPFSF